jgi:hypothetical protein
MNWFRAHKQNAIDHAGAGASIEGDNVIQFSPATSNENTGAAALGLIDQVADLFEKVDGYASERHTQAESLARQSIERLKAAEARARWAEAGRYSAEARTKQLSDRVADFCAKMEAVEKIMEQTVSRLTATEAQLAAAEQRATEAENALKTVEGTILSRILTRVPGNPGGVATAPTEACVLEIDRPEWASRSCAEAA